MLSKRRAHVSPLHAETNEELYEEKFLIRLMHRLPVFS